MVTERDLRPDPLRGLAHPSEPRRAGRNPRVASVATGEQAWRYQPPGSAGIDETVARAAAIAAMPRRPGSAPLADANRAPTPSSAGWTPPPTRTRAPGRRRPRGHRRRRGRGLTVSGAYSIEAQRLTVANTTGLLASHRVTQAKLVTVMTGPAGKPATPRPSAPTIGASTPTRSGRRRPSARPARRRRRPRAGGVPRRAGRVRRGRGARVPRLHGLLGLAIEEGSACVELGKQVFGSNVTIWDDGGIRPGSRRRSTSRGSPSAGSSW